MCLCVRVVYMQVYNCALSNPELGHCILLAAEELLRGGHAFAPQHGPGGGFTSRTEGGHSVDASTLLCAFQHLLLSSDPSEICFLAVSHDWAARSSPHLFLLQLSRLNRLV